MTHSWTVIRGRSSRPTQEGPGLRLRLPTSSPRSAECLHRDSVFSVLRDRARSAMSPSKVPPGTADTESKSVFQFALSIGDHFSLRHHTCVKRGNNIDGMSTNGTQRTSIWILRMSALEKKRTSLIRSLMSANDPKRTFQFQENSPLWHPDVPSPYRGYDIVPKWQWSRVYGRISTRA
jgi:hypothetical protein